MHPTARSPAFDEYWRFAAKRHDAYLARLAGRPGPWTADPIIAQYRFTNTYRAADRVSQFLIEKVQYDRSNDVSSEDLIFRTLLFKIFNNIDTWVALESDLGPIRWHGFDFDKADQLLDRRINGKGPIYSAAYIMPAPPFGAKRKHSNHLRLLKHMMDDRFPAKMEASTSLSQLYHLIHSYPGLGPFLAYQYAIDLNYSELTDFDEDEFVVAGPGAHDGIRKCFPTASPDQAEDIIFWMVEHQDQEFSRLGIDFGGLFGRKLKAIDCQNIFCEISKYCRVSYPDLQGTNGRTRIKQHFGAAGRHDVPKPFFPPKWQLRVDIPQTAYAYIPPDEQYELRV